MDFDEQRYLEEMKALITTAKNRLRANFPDIQVYTVNIWTDPNAAVSAINLDTYENSSTVVGQYNKWASEKRDKWLERGSAEFATSFIPLQDRSRSIADFAFKEFERIEHQSFDPNWEDRSQGRCWALLEPALLKVRAMARQVLADLKLHPKAEVSVNSQRDWYDHPAPIAR